MLKKMTVLTLFVLFSTFVIAVAAFAANIPVPNASLEEIDKDGVPTGWVFWSNKPEVCTYGADDLESIDGKYCFKIVNKEEAASVLFIDLKIPNAEPGMAYEFVVRVKGKGIAGRHGLVIATDQRDKDGNVVVGEVWPEEVLGSFDWREYKGMFVIEEGVETVRLGLRLWGASGTAWFDKVEISEY